MKELSLFILLVFTLLKARAQSDFAPLPFKESFEATWTDTANGFSKNMPAKFWSNDPYTGNNSWRRDDEGSFANWTNPSEGWYRQAANGTSRSARFHSSQASQGSWGSLCLFLNCVNGYASKELTFYYYNPNGSDSLLVDLSTDGGISFTTLRSLGVAGSSWNLYTLGFVSASANTIIKFKAKAGATWSDIQIDEVAVKPVPCFKPSGVSVKPLINSADLFITPSFAGNPTGYVYAITTSPAAPSSGTYSASGTTVLTGLNSGSNYYVHVRSVCTGSGSSEWLTSSFKTAAINCTPAYNDTCAGRGPHDFIRLFSIKGENGTSIRKENNRCTYNYVDYTANSIVSLTKGKSYSVVVGTDTMTSVNIWIDHNDDGAFTYNEKLVNNYVTAISKANNLVTLFIPSSFGVGTHKMRIRTNSDDPCDIIYTGKAQDYLVEIGSGNSLYNISAGVANNCAQGGGINISEAANNNTVWVPLLDSTNHIIAAVNANGNDLGRVNVYEYINNGVVRTSADGKKYLDRNIQIAVETQPVTEVSLRLYLLQSEFDALKAADAGISSLNDLNVTKTAQACGSTLGTGMLLQPANSGVEGNGYFVEYSIPGFSSFFLHRIGVLPITLTNFKAAKFQDFNLVTWKTAAEKDNAGFEIEVSTDGNKFERLAFVASNSMAGSSTSPTAYSYKDYKVSASDKYYRLKQVSKDGKITYSNVVVIKGGKLSSIQLGGLHPNPVRNSFRLNVSSPVADDVSITINSTSGITLISKTQSIGATDNTITMDASALPAGTYFIKVTSTKTGKQVFEKFVKL